MNKKIGIIGFGNMGQAIAAQLKNDYRIFVFDKDKNKTEGLGSISTAAGNVELAKETDALILAVKPQDFDAVLDELKNEVKDKLIISIAAGITTGYIEKILGIVRIIRAMPNMPAMVGEGITCLSKGKFASIADLDFTENLFDYLGETLRIEEEMMNAATAVSGSGPGFCFELMRAKNTTQGNMEEAGRFIKEDFAPLFAKAATNIGFLQADAEFLALRTANGCIALLRKTKFSLSELINQIASKGGTTEAGLEVLRKGGSLEEAVKAARKRAEELCRKE